MSVAMAVHKCFDKAHKFSWLNGHDGSLVNGFAVANRIDMLIFVQFDAVNVRLRFGTLSR